MRTFSPAIAILMTASVTLVAGATAQTQAPPAGQRPPAEGVEKPRRGAEKKLEGQVQSVDPSGRGMTLTDGTTLMAPPGTAIRPGAITAGMTVIASYTEENGEKVLTDLTVKEPSASPSTAPGSPGGPSPAPPTRSPR